MITRKLSTYSILGLMALFALLSCAEDPEYFDPVAQYEKDQVIIKEYISDKGWDATNVDSTGVFIVFTKLADSTSVEYPTRENDVTLSYTGTLLDGSFFDGTDDGETVTFALSNLISGWQIAIPKMRPGDRATILIPSYYAYGPYGQGSIPPNTVLLFDIFLESFE